MSILDSLTDSISNSLNIDFTSLNNITGLTGSPYTGITDKTVKQSYNAPTGTIKFPTDYNLKSIYISSPTLKSTVGGDLNLKDYLLELSYFEDIFNNTISGKIVVSDAVGIIFLGGLNGSEILKMEFSSISGGPMISHTFRIFSVSDKSYDMSTNFESYTINFCSEEVLISEKYRICKSYNGKTVTSMVTDICKNFLKTQKSISDFDNTYGILDIILPNKKIFETINWLVTYALSSNTQSGSDIVFFENSSGYHLKSLQTLYNQKEKYTYICNPKNTVLDNNTGDFNTKTFNILNLVILNVFDTLDATIKGTFSNRTITLDPLIRKKVYSDFSYQNYIGKSKKLNNNNVLTMNNNNTYQDRFGKSIGDAPPKDMDAGNLRVVMTNTSQKTLEYIKSKPKSVTNPMYPEKTIPNRNAQLMLANYTKIKILVPGNAALTVGDLIYIKMYNSDNIGGTRTEDKYISGKYLITAVRHIITITRFISVVELAKESNIS